MPNLTKYRFKEVLLINLFEKKNLEKTIFQIYNLV